LGGRLITGLGGGTGSLSGARDRVAKLSARAVVAPGGSIDTGSDCSRPRCTSSTVRPNISQRLKGRDDRPKLGAFSTRQIHPELLELAVQVGTLEPRLFSHPGHGAVFLGQMEFEIGFFIFITALA